MVTEHIKEQSEGLLLFDIKRYAIHDGPGIRTTLFLKGCPLRCVWCHNPESWSPHPRLTFKEKKCIHCGSCVGKTDEVKAEVCPTMAREMCGRNWTLEEIIREVEKEREVMTESGGGVTLCGGEPMMQDIVPLLQELGKRGFHRAVDTSLYCTEEKVREVARECDLFLIDIKHTDPELHRRYTGVSNERILEHIRLVAELGVPFIIRIPLIEGVNADETNMEATACFLASLPVAPLVELLPYHDTGKDKHRRIGSRYNPEGIAMSTPTDEQIEYIIRFFKGHGLTARIG